MRSPLRHHGHFWCFSVHNSSTCWSLCLEKLLSASPAPFVPQWLLPSWEATCLLSLLSLACDNTDVEIHSCCHVASREESSCSQCVSCKNRVPVQIFGRGIIWVSLCADYPAMETRPEGGRGERLGGHRMPVLSLKMHWKFLGYVLERPRVCPRTNPRVPKGKKESFRRE